MCDHCKKFNQTSDALVAAAIEELASGPIPHRENANNSRELCRQFARYSLMMCILQSEATEQKLSHTQAWAMMTGWVAKSLEFKR